MGIPRREHANGRAAIREQTISSSFFFSLLIILHISPPFHSLPTMAITTRSVSSKEKPFSKAPAITTATPTKRHQDRRSGRLARSPQTSNINNHLAEINRPFTRLDNVLEAFRPSKSPTPDDPNDNLDAPCDITLPINKSGRQTTLNFHTGVDIHDKTLQAPANNASPPPSNTTDT
jgi:hypothetical protein